MANVRATTLVSLAQAKRFMQLTTCRVLASPAPTTTGATVLGDVGGFRAGSLVTIDLTGGPEQANIATITGQALTWTPAVSLAPVADDPISDGTYDESLSTFLDDLSEFIEGYTGRVYKKRSAMVERFTADGRRAWFTKYYPIANVAIAIDGVVQSSAWYAVDPDLGKIKFHPGYSFNGSGREMNVTVTYDAGYADAVIPADAIGLFLKVAKIQYDGWRTGGQSVTMLNLGGAGLSVVQDWPKHLQRELQNLRDDARQMFMMSS